MKSKNPIKTAAFAVATLGLGIASSSAAAIAVTATTFDNAFATGTKQAINTAYNLTSLTANSTLYSSLEGGVASSVTTGDFIFGNQSITTDPSHVEGTATNAAAVSGLNLAIGIGNQTGGFWQFSKALDQYAGFAFFELSGQETMQLTVVNSSNVQVGTLTVTSSAYGLEGSASTSPAGGWYRHGNGGQFSNDTGPVGTFFTESDFTGTGDLSTATGFRLTGATGIDPLALVAVNVPEPSAALLSVLAALTIGLRRKRC